MSDSDTTSDTENDAVVERAKQTVARNREHLDNSTTFVYFTAVAMLFLGSLAGGVQMPFPRRFLVGLFLVGLGVDAFSPPEGRLRPATLAYSAVATAVIGAAVGFLSWPLPNRVVGGLVLVILAVDILRYSEDGVGHGGSTAE